MLRRATLFLRDSLLQRRITRLKIIVLRLSLVRIENRNGLFASCWVGRFHKANIGLGVSSRHGALPEKNFSAADGRT